EPVVKSFDEVENLVFMGTTVIYGQGIMVIEKTGQTTKIGKIGLSLAEMKEESTPLQKQLKKLTKNLILLVSAICLVIFIAGVLKGGSFLQTLRFSIVLSLAAIPEGMPIAITVILALGMRRILKKKGLVKKLLSLETLGLTSVICLDKTGTLTEGKMQVVKTDFIDKNKAILALILLNDRKVAIEAAIWNYLEKESPKNPDIVFNSYERLDEESFDSSKKYKSVINKVDGKNMLFVMGAPEILIDSCSNQKADKEIVLQKINNWAEKGLRLIGLASKEDAQNSDKKDLSWMGLVGIEDPIRKEAKESLSEAQSAGIDIKIVTGDFLLTALKVAKKIGMDINSRNVIDFEELDKISDDELQDRIGEVKLFARVTPLQKLRIINALQKKGEIVAMTGDGVNDALALKKSDIGIVVENGTEVAKEAGDLILLDSNFKTIIATCEEGRLILSNIKKVIGYIISNSFAEIILIFLSMLFGLPIPLTVAQILWINLICDGPPDITLGFEPKEPGLMNLDPRKMKEEKILSNDMKLLILIVSLTVGLSVFLVFWYYANFLHNLILARTMSFTILATVSMVYIFAFKNLRKLLIQTENPFQNRPLILGVTYGLLLTFLAVNLPFLNKLLDTIPLSLQQWIIVISISLLTVSVIEASKIISLKVLRHSTL
ncbi:hypothetical protein A2159_02340, partial [Candidatus Woesebacteria bacterium RBG_13_34_9]